MTSSRRRSAWRIRTDYLCGSGGAAIWPGTGGIRANMHIWARCRRSPVDVLHMHCEMLSFELFIIVFLIVINGLLSMAELAVVSSRPARLSHLASKGVRGAGRALALASDPGKFLSTVQIWITL